MTTPSTTTEPKMAQKRPGPEKDPSTRPKKDSILDLTPYMGRAVQVKLLGGKEVRGTLRGFDQICNLVLDQTTEFREGIEGERKLGLIFVRGPTVVMIGPVDGFEVIENPFLGPEEA